MSDSESYIRNLIDSKWHEGFDLCCEEWVHRLLVAGVAKEVIIEVFKEVKGHSYPCPNRCKKQNKGAYE